MFYFDLIEKSVSLKFPSRKFSIELKKLFFNLEVSATETADEKITKDNTINKYLFILSILNKF